MDAKSRKSAYYQANKARILERTRKYTEINKEKKAAYNKEYRLANKEEISAQRKEKRMKDKDERRPQRRRYYENNSYQIRSKRLISKYGVSLEEYEKQFNLQDRKCKICNREHIPGKINFPIDHDHLTGKNRSIICKRCNIGLGEFQDNVRSLLKAAFYILYWQAAHSWHFYKTKLKRRH